MDPVSLIVTGLASGAASGIAESTTEAVKVAYSRLRRLVSDRLAGRRNGEIALAEHETDPETWRAPLVKALRESGAESDSAMIEAAEQLMELLDEAGMRAGKYNIEVSDSQGVQVGDSNIQVNKFQSDRR